MPCRRRVPGETPLICFQLAANCAQKFPKSAGLASPTPGQKRDWWWKFGSVDSPKSIGRFNSKIFDLTLKNNDIVLFSLSLYGKRC